MHKKKILIILACLIIFPSFESKADVTHGIVAGALGAALIPPMIVGGILALGVGAGVAYGVIKLNRHLNQKEEMIAPAIVSDTHNTIKQTKKVKKPRKTLFSKILNKNKATLVNPAIA